MSSKYVIVIPASANYIPGLNATLNGLDKYGNTADVKVIESEIPKDYQEKARKVFDFDVEFIPLLDLCEGEYSVDLTRPSAFYRWVFSPYALYMRIKDQYKAATLIGADMIVINNIMPWFEVAEKTGMLVTIDNPYTMSSMWDLDERHIRLNGLLDTEPISDACFMDLQLHEDIIKKTLEYSKITDENMRAFNSAVFNLKKFDRLLILDSQLWTSGIFYLFKVEKSMGANNRMSYYANRERMNAFHKKYWLDSVIYQAIYDKVPGTWLYDNAMNNIKTFCDIYRELNTRHKLTWDYPANEIFNKLKSGEVLLKYQKMQNV